MGQQPKLIRILHQLKSSYNAWDGNKWSTYNWTPRHFNHLWTFECGAVLKLYVIWSLCLSLKWRTKLPRWVYHLLQIRHRNIFTFWVFVPFEFMPDAPPWLFCAPKDNADPFVFGIAAKKWSMLSLGLIVEIIPSTTPPAGMLLGGNSKIGSWLLPLSLPGASSILTLLSSTCSFGNSSTLSSSDESKISTILFVSTRFGTFNKQTDQLESIQIQTND